MKDQERNQEQDKTGEERGAACACGYTCEWCKRGRHSWCTSGVCKA
jgi:hypothetical protein